MKNEPAFPRPASRHEAFDAHLPSQTGMTMRDYFAAKAMQADMTQGIHEEDFKETASRAYKMADDMLEARIV